MPKQNIEIILVEYLLKNEKFAFIRSPVANGDPWTDPNNLVDESNNIRKLIFEKLSFTKNIKGKFNVTLSKNSMIALSGDKNLEAERKLHFFMDNDVVLNLIAIFDLNSKAVQAMLMNFCESYLARLDKIKTQDDLILFFKEQKLSKTIINEFIYCVTKAAFLFSVTDTSFAKVDEKIVLLNGGFIKIISHIKETCADYTENEMRKLDLEISKIAEALRKLINEKIHESEESNIADFLDEYIAKIESISTHENMLVFLVEQGVNKSLVDCIKSILEKLSPSFCKSDLESMHTKILLLNGENEKIYQEINSQRNDFITRVNSQLSENIDKLINHAVTEIITKKIECADDRTECIEFSKQVLNQMDSIKCFDTFALFVRMLISKPSGEKFLVQLKWQKNALTKRNKESDTLEYLMERILFLKQQVKQAKVFNEFLNEIEVQLENHEVICSRKDLSSFVLSLSPDNIKEKMPLLYKCGFSVELVNSANMIQFNALKIQKLTNLLSQELSLNGERETMLTTTNSPIYSHYDRFVATSEVTENSVLPSIQFLILMASKKLIIDSNLNLKNTHLILMAPVIEISKQSVITLVGDSGKVHKEAKAPNSKTAGECGMDGKDGKPGFSPGTLILIALDVINPNKLLVISKGGDGGDGQDGGDGKNAELGIKKVTGSTAIDGKVAAWAAAIPFFGTGFAIGRMLDSSKEKVRFEHDETYLKEPATGGGKGGNGGIGAHYGEVKILIKNETESANCSTEYGSMGNPGRGGRVGDTPSLPSSSENATLKLLNGADGETPTAFAALANNIYKIEESAIMKSQITKFISLSSKGNSVGETSNFIEFLSSESIEYLLS